MYPRSGILSRGVAFAMVFECLFLVRTFLFGKLQITFSRLRHCPRWDWRIVINIRVILGKTSLLPDAIGFKRRRRDDPASHTSINIGARECKWAPNP